MRTFSILGLALAMISVTSIADGMVDTKTPTQITPGGVSTSFTPYYPKGCSIAAKSCICIQDSSKFKNIWYTKANNKKMKWSEAQGWSTVLNANEQNPNGTCGIKTGWGLPNNSQLTYLLNDTVSLLNQHGFIGVENSGISYWGGTCHLTRCRQQDWQGHSYTLVPSYLYAYLYDPSTNKFILQTKEPCMSLGGAIAVVATEW